VREVLGFGRECWKIGDWRVWGLKLDRTLIDEFGGFILMKERKEEKEC
jgi:hypothetical protein